jgi:hypothetical protein
VGVRISSAAQKLISFDQLLFLFQPEEEIFIYIAVNERPAVFAKKIID